MSYALRHRPAEFGIELDEEGWTNLEGFAQKMDTTVLIVEQVVAQDNKQRYTIENGRIRAAQGHTVPVKIKYATPTPPAFLWHGTTDVAFNDIQKNGLLPMKRQHVHLSASREQAVIVGKRHKGRLVVLKVDTTILRRHTKLMLAENGVWLAEVVPAECLIVD